MADHKRDAVTDKLVCHRYALLGVGNVVTHFDLDLLPQDTASLVDVFDGLLDALGQLSAEGRVGSRDRSGDREFDLRLRCASEQQRQGEGHGLENGCSHINLLCELKG
jgi:hypothetical protein